MVARIPSKRLRLVVAASRSIAFLMWQASRCSSSQSFELSAAFIAFATPNTTGLCQICDHPLKERSSQFLHSSLGAVRWRTHFLENFQQRVHSRCGDLMFGAEHWDSYLSSRRLQRPMDADIGDSPVARKISPQSLSGAMRQRRKSLFARAPADNPPWLWRTRLPIDVDLPSHANERAAAVTHLPALRPGAVVVSDRGYYSFLLLHTHVLRSLHTVFRPQSNASALVADFVRSQHTDEIVTV